MEVTWKPMRTVMLVGKDWAARALVRAQLIEEGVSVEAHETVEEALPRLPVRELLPALLVRDFSASSDPEGEADLLAPRVKDLPIWIIASKDTMPEKNLKSRGFEMALFKPLDLGEVVRQIKRRLAGAPRRLLGSPSDRPADQENS